MIIEYDLNRIEFVKTQKTKYVIQTSEHIFQVYRFHYSQ